MSFVVGTAAKSAADKQKKKITAKGSEKKPGKKKLAPGKTETTKVKETGARAEKKSGSKKADRQAKRAEKKAGRQDKRAAKKAGRQEKRAERKGSGKRIAKGLITGGASEAHKLKKKVKGKIKSKLKEAKSKVKGAKEKVKTKVKETKTKVKTAVKKKINTAATAVAGATSVDMHGPASYNMSVPAKKLQYIQSSSGKYDNIGGPSMNADHKMAIDRDKISHLKGNIHSIDQKKKGLSMHGKGGSSLSKHMKGRWK